jgi:prepilin-type N-terminal cleavage/methylation domain-containing protein
MKANRRAYGFTLPEIMISLVMLGFVSTLALTLVMGTNTSSTRVRVVGDAQTSGRLGLEALAADIRAAGAGLSSGQVGIAPGGGAARRVPVIYSGPTTTVTAPGGQTITSNSLFIVTGDPSTVGTPADASGMQGVVVTASQNAPLTIVCVDASGASVDCATGLLKTLSPLLVGDFRDAVYLTPTVLGAPQGTPATQQLTYAEQAGTAYAPNPKAPFGFVPGAILTRIRVVHWYLWQPSATERPQLRRSFPTLTTTALNAACANGDLPFLDETNDGSGNSPVGADMSGGAIESLQIRFMTDPSNTDDPAQFTQINSIGVCDVAVPTTLREVRLQVVARTTVPDVDQATRMRKLYSTPGFEGTSPSSTTQDAYPRRAFTVSVAPRSLQGVRL